jgi:hypothetical protein
LPECDGPLIKDLNDPFNALRLQSVFLKPSIKFIGGWDNPFIANGIIYGYWIGVNAPGEVVSADLVRVTRSVERHFWIEPITGWWDGISFGVTKLVHYTIVVDIRVRMLASNMCGDTGYLDNIFRITKPYTSDNSWNFTISLSDAGGLTKAPIKPPVEEDQQEDVADDAEQVDDHGDDDNEGEGGPADDADPSIPPPQYKWITQRCHVAQFDSSYRCNNSFFHRDDLLSQLRARADVVEIEAPKFEKQITRNIVCDPYYGSSIYLDQYIIRYKVVL